ncbi:ATP-binding SpoIIE family protein phosphatase [Streptomyces sp. CB01881]|uniref:ATP-binding SpoIIE family protein phosphatase n=1 Tax=Streptomyces sp. CB01881 TaxID=2078691 RepID=UPI000CDC4037|nr:ATP-binding SpoIIE family protein phosphatase [Streptomyces sp. CB01881]AUY50017.1 protein phosphatase [Streptomyces sp. CB01881]TYC73414.1 GAF domain-containing protein [Streptomyces sp. CB01881]
MRDQLKPEAGQPPALPGQRRPPPRETGSGEVAERLALLDHATRRVNSALDLAATLRNICRVLVPTLADAAIVHLRDPLPNVEREPGFPDELRIHHSLGTRLGRRGRPTAGGDHRGSRHGSRYGSRSTADTGPATPVTRGGALAHTLLSRRPAEAAVLGTAGRDDGTTDRATERTTELLRELYGARGLARLGAGSSVLALPLRGRKAVLGLLVLIRRPPERTGRPGFDAADTATAAHLTTQAGLAVDTALRYAREWEIANELQRSMLPLRLPQPHGVRLSQRYLPGERGAQVGGDWYDAVPLPGNRVALIVGDVMGHSLTSAAIMGQLRTSAQTLAALDLPPHEVLYHLDEQAQRLGREQHLATCVYAVYDPIANRVVLANAGHVPPVLVRPDGTAELLELDSGAPIGVGGVDFSSVELPAPPGSALLLFTDGLVETRNRPISDGLELLRARLATVQPQAPEQLCQEALRILPPGDRGDDIALLAACFDGIPAGDVAHWYLQPRNETPGRARRLAAHTLRRWGLEGLSEATELMVSELVTNAVQHATRPVTLSLVRTTRLRCEVGDDSPLLPRPRRTGPEDERGRGLQIVARCAERWGATRLGTGKVVWFEQRLP